MKCNQPPTPGEVEKLTCPCCSSVEFLPVVSFHKVPVTGQQAPKSSDFIETTQLDFIYCIKCNFVQIESPKVKPFYEEKPRATASQLPKYIGELLGLITPKKDSKQGLVVEIGCNDGTFLSLLESVGISNLIGVEPSKALSKVCESNGFKVINDYFTDQIVKKIHDKYGHPSLVVCRHTLEHIPNPLLFMSDLYELIEVGGRCLVEVPDSRVILERLNFTELWDEHLNYFMEGNLLALSERVGFSPIFIASYNHLETKNIVLLLEKRIVTKKSISSRHEVASWDDFAIRFRLTKDRLSEVIKSSRSPIYIIGASHPQLNFINYLSIGGFIKYLIDDDPSKLGQIPAILGDGIKVISTQEFEKCASGGTLLLTGFGYPEWSSRLIEIAKNNNLAIVDPHKLYELL